MTVLITGGAGYIGSHMALRLIDEGEDVIICDDLSRGDMRVVPPGAEFFHQDVGDTQAMTRILKTRGVDAVIHFAGYIIVPESVRDPELYYRRNTVTSLNLLGACGAAGVDKLIFSSTAAVYGEPESSPIGENAATRPVSPYGASKLMTERMLADLGAASPLRSVCLRYFNVAGADLQMRSGQASPEATHLIKVISQVAAGLRDKLMVFGTDYPTPDGSCVRDYIHVTDLVDAHYLALKHLRAGGGSRVFNCGYGVGASVLEVVRAFEGVAGRSLPVEQGPRRPGDPAILIADSDAICRELGWRPQHADLGEIIRSALAWEERLKTLKPPVTAKT